MWWKKHTWKILVPVLFAVILAGAFWYGGGAPGMQGWSVEGGSTPAATPALPKTEPQGAADAGFGNAAGGV